MVMSWSPEAWNGNYVSSAELYDPATATWTPTTALAFARSLHTATLLPSGTVLVAGGHNNGGFLASTECYRSEAGACSATGPLNTGRYYHTATLLPNGKVLAAAGSAPQRVYFSSAELYDPTTGS